MIEMNFAESVDYLYSLGNEVEAMKLGLENIRTLLAGLGKPCVDKPKVQVAGTNGKGSVCAFLDAICMTAGIKIGLFTSPHLVSITERIKINGVAISEANFARMASFVRDTSEWLVERGTLESVPTYFEQVTAIALVAFANAGVELVVLETGLGGRLDATTAAHAEIVAITRIDYDHQEYLGETIQDIAGEKAAIIHEGSKVVIGEQTNEALEIILDRCSTVGALPMLASQVRTTYGSGWLNFTTEKSEYNAGKLGLFGHHQIENAKVALLVAESLQDRFPISAGNISEGLQIARHPGRLEYQENFLFDGAHNLGGANALAEYISEFETRPITLVFGAMRGKNVSGILEVLAPLAERIIITEPSNSRSFSYEELLERWPAEISKERAFATDNVISAMDIANKVTANDGLILVTGSLYLVGEAKKILNN